MQRTSTCHRILTVPNLSPLVQSHDDRQTDTGRHAQIQAHNEQQRRNTIMYSFQSSMWGRETTVSICVLHHTPSKQWIQHKHTQSTHKEQPVTMATHALLSLDKGNRASSWVWVWSRTHMQLQQHRGQIHQCPASYYISCSALTFINLTAHFHMQNLGCLPGHGAEARKHVWYHSDTCSICSSRRGILMEFWLEVAGLLPS